MGKWHIELDKGTNFFKIWSTIISTGVKLIYFDFIALIINLELSEWYRVKRFLSSCVVDIFPKQGEVESEQLVFATRHLFLVQLSFNFTTV